MSSKSLSVFLPVYNEEKTIDSVISGMIDVIEPLAEDYEILLINDGSTDRSKDAILRWMQKKDRIRLINHETNLGYGAALKDGFTNANRDLIFYTDADMPVDLHDIKKILPLMEQYDLVIGYRINREDTPRRFIYSKIYNFLIRVLLGVKVRDANFSFKCVRKEVIKKCNLSAMSVFIDGELLAEAVRNNFTIKEIPIVYKPRKHGISNFDNMKVAMATGKELIYYWINKRLLKKKDR